MTIRIGTAGWSLYRAGEAFPAEGTVLERYAARLNAVEINTSFYRPHQRKTYERWAASTPEDFRFAVKVPQAITHERRLVGADDLLARFLEETDGLGAKRGPLLIQLPPSLAFEAERVGAFLASWRDRTDAPTVLEPRHASWFEDQADDLLAAHHVARVAADPAVVPSAAEPGGWRKLIYHRLHGSPVMYASAYESEALDALTARLSDEAKSVETWCVFDNTRFGAATWNALALREIPLS
ncbi:DUF72 domain-containing protein [Caulobacter segnis]|uniref:DUF72 domain-containing protein n=2 Tax=Caulobacter segnis TaxID=88688 RepID=D5VLJ9_CAUST|nr:DUF72 domain-containing protein [Caulobacter segnis]ADG11372.1 protein of unknown function DUF72 [Caulobacter segnis ATCC 21756]AVQ03042.1 DUF72 domain-containing protein [Caulobacter segnis]